MRFKEKLIEQRKIEREQKKKAKSKIINKKVWKEIKEEQKDKRYSVSKEFWNYINCWANLNEHKEITRKNKISKFGLGYKKAISDIFKHIKIERKCFCNGNKFWKPLCYECNLKKKLKSDSL
jgi:hypothetical protein